MSSSDVDLWIVVSTTSTQILIAIWGAVKYKSLMRFCDATTRTSGRYNAIKMLLMILVYLYPATVVVSTLTSWMAYIEKGADKASLNAISRVTVALPFLVLLFFPTVVVVTRNDISNYVDLARVQRSKLPAQGPPPPLFPDPEGGNPSVIMMPPPPGASPDRDATAVNMDARYSTPGGQSRSRASPMGHGGPPQELPVFVASPPRPSATPGSRPPIPLQQM